MVDTYNLVAKRISLGKTLFGFPPPSRHIHFNKTMCIQTNHAIHIIHTMHMYTHSLTHGMVGKCTVYLVAILVNHTRPLYIPLRMALWWGTGYEAAHCSLVTRHTDMDSLMLHEAYMSGLTMWEFDSQLKPTSQHYIANGTALPDCMQFRQI